MIHNNNDSVVKTQSLAHKPYDFYITVYHSNHTKIEINLPSSRKEVQEEFWCNLTTQLIPKFKWFFPHFSNCHH